MDNPHRIRAMNRCCRLAIALSFAATLLPRPALAQDIEKGTSVEIAILGGRWIVGRVVGSDSTSISVRVGESTVAVGRGGIARIYVRSQRTSAGAKTLGVSAGAAGAVFGGAFGGPAGAILGGSVVGTIGALSGSAVGAAIPRWQRVDLATRVYKTSDSHLTGCGRTGLVADGGMAKLNVSGGKHGWQGRVMLVTHCEPDVSSGIEVGAAYVPFTTEISEADGRTERTGFGGTVTRAAFVSEFRIRGSGLPVLPALVTSFGIYRAAERHLSMRPTIVGYTTSPETPYYQQPVIQIREAEYDYTDTGVGLGLGLSLSRPLTESVVAQVQGRGHFTTVGVMSSWSAGLRLNR